MTRVRLRRKQNLTIPGVIAEYKKLSAEAKLVFGAMIQMNMNQEETTNYVEEPHAYAAKVCGMPIVKVTEAIEELVDQEFFYEEYPKYIFAVHDILKNAMGEFVFGEEQDG